MCAHQDVVGATPVRHFTVSSSLQFPTLARGQLKNISRISRSTVGADLEDTDSLLAVTSCCFEQWESCVL